jgi:hypothetical protein
LPSITEKEKFKTAEKACFDKGTMTEWVKELKASNLLDLLLFYLDVSFRRPVNLDCYLFECFSNFQLNAIIKKGFHVLNMQETSRLFVGFFSSI